jgi:hypothetical protein
MLVEVLRRRSFECMKQSSFITIVALLGPMLVRGVSAQPPDIHAPTLVYPGPAQPRLTVPESHAPELEPPVLDNHPLRIRPRIRPPTWEFLPHLDQERDRHELPRPGE